MGCLFRLAGDAALLCTSAAISLKHAKSFDGIGSGGSTHGSAADRVSSPWLCLSERGGYGAIRDRTGTRRLRTHAQARGQETSRGYQDTEQPHPAAAPRLECPAASCLL